MNKGIWIVYARYTDWQGKTKVLHKRGFKTKRDAEGKGYSPTYLKTISAQMSAIFNHATRYYDFER